MRGLHFNSAVSVFTDIFPAAEHFMLECLYHYTGEIDFFAGEGFFTELYIIARVIIVELFTQ